MNRYFATLTSAFLIFASLLVSHGTLRAQADNLFAEELRPFDFNDKYYQANGIYAYTLIGRKNGADKASVFDQTTDARFTNVRITETRPAYSADGSTIFWNLYGGATKASLTSENGGDAYNLAEAYPIYIFPSATVKNIDRQAVMMLPDEAYFAKNPLGISSIILVEYSDKFFTKQAWRIRQMLEQRNGVSLDGTPVIKTQKDLSILMSEGLVNLRRPEHQDEAYFLIAKAIQYPSKGGITPDAFLDYVKQSNGQPLDAESHFLKAFECVKSYDGACL